MKRNYLTITAIVTVLGVAFIFLPASYTIHLAPEQVTLWEDTTTGTDYSFNTGPQSVDDGVSPYIKVWSDTTNTMNTSFIITGMGETMQENNTYNPAEILLPGPGEWTAEITGNIIEGTSAEINAGFYYLRPLEPEVVTYYPYRYFGYGMTLIGLISSLIIYTRNKETV